MATSDRYATIVVAVLELAQEIGRENAHADAAEACYRLLEEAIAQAQVWNVPLEEIGLAGFDPADLLREPVAANHEATV
jgi:hypothetical protein